MSNNDHAQPAVTEQFPGRSSTAEPKTADDHASQSQRMADVTAAYRAALAEEDAQQNHNATLQLGINPKTGARLSDSEYDSQEADVEELILDADSHGSLSAQNFAAESEEEVADDVDDLNSYMQSFLQRMKVDSSNTPAGGAPESVESPAKPESTTPAAKTAAESQREYAGPKAAPECKNDISAMRELANESTKVSLSDHAARRGKRVGRYMALSASCCVGAGGLALATQSIHSYLFIAAVATYGGAMFAAWRAWAGLKELSSGKRKSKPGSVVEEAQPREQSAEEVLQA